MNIKKEAIKTFEADQPNDQDQLRTWSEIRETIGASIDAPQDTDIRVTVLGIALHELWLRTRRRNPEGILYADGRLEPRTKQTVDQVWISEHAGMSEVDIASKFFPDLPTDWRAENLAAAEVIDELVQSFGGAEKIDLTDQGVRQVCGSAIHDKWLERNTYARGGGLDVPFADLPDDEQAKDLVQLEFALEILAPASHDDNPQPWMTRVWKSMNNWALDRNLPMRSIDGDWISPESFYYRDQVDLRRAGLR